MTVDEYSRPFGDLRLCSVGRGKDAVGKPCTPALFEARGECFIELHRAAENSRDRRLGEIIARRSETTCGNHRPRPVESFPYRLRNPFRFVADGCATYDLDSARRQRAGDVRRVGIYREAEEELVTNGDQLDLARVQRANTPA